MPPHTLKKENIYSLNLKKRIFLYLYLRFRFFYKKKVKEEEDEREKVGEEHRH